MVYLPRLGVLGWVCLSIGCATTDVVVTEVAWPVMTLDADTLSFGAVRWQETSTQVVWLANEGISADDEGMTMGVGEIAIGEQMGDNFAVRFDTSEINCTSGDTKSQPQADTAVTGDSGTDTAADPGSPAMLLLYPGCRIPLHVDFTPRDLGTVWGALIVTSVRAPGAEELPAGIVPEYAEDPVHRTQEVYLQGETLHAEGRLLIQPRSVDFGYVYPSVDAGSDAEVGLTNIGDGDLTLHVVAASATCDEAFQVVSTPALETVLVPGGVESFRVAFHPTTPAPASCQVEVRSDDQTEPTQYVTFIGNAGTGTPNTPPVLTLLDPEPGGRIEAGQDFLMELVFADAEQAASSLDCTVRSAVIQERDLVSCATPDDSGVITVAVPSSVLVAGVDTLVARVVDGAGAATEVAVSVVIATDYPDDDDDGDGFGTSGVVADCDDTRRDTFPAAVEAADGQDNNCDGRVDETTADGDDDGDGYTENGGDCDDEDPTRYPGAGEPLDGFDTDCDGVVDDGTSGHDDDGDGFTEAENDCSDSDPAVNPIAVETCDHRDEDCDGVTDDACVPYDTPPVVIGVVRTRDADACVAGETLILEVKAFDRDGQIPLVSWFDGTDRPEVFDPPDHPITRWTCPDPDAGNLPDQVDVAVMVSDLDGNIAVGWVKIDVYPADFGLRDVQLRYDEPMSAGCVSSPHGSVVGLLAAVGLLLARRARVLVGGGADQAAIPNRARAAAWSRQVSRCVSKPKEASQDGSNS